MKILFTGGGTGGHIFPIVAIIREIKIIYSSKKEPKEPMELYFVGPESDIGLELLKDEGVIVKTILAGKIRRYFSPTSILRNIIDIIFKIPIGFVQSFLYLRRIQPNIVFSKGGYGALPINWVAEKFKIPIFLHESDIVPGRITKFSSQAAKKIFTSFEQTETNGLPIEKIYCTGNPIRKEILNGSIEGAKRIFNLTNEKPIILIWGGSQGAERINDLILGMLPDLVKNFEIIHQCGKKQINEMRATAQIIIKEEKLFKYYHAVGFFGEEELKHALGACHLIVSRAGSGAIFEIAAVGKPSILLPLPEASQDHQAKNANTYAATGAAVVMESKNPTPALLYSKIMAIFSNPENLREMSQSALDFAKPNAAKIIAEKLIPQIISPETIKIITE